MPIDWAMLTSNAIATLAAAYAGSAAAFHVAGRQETAKAKKDQVEECNRAMLVMAKQYEFATGHRDQILAQFRNHPARHLAVPASTALNFDYLRLNPAALSFLLQTEATEAPHILSLADDRFHIAIAAVNARTLLHHELQQHLNAAGLGPYGLDPAQVESKIGPRLSNALRSQTDQCYARIDDVIDTHENLGARLPLVFKALYPGFKFVGFSPKPLS